MKTNYIYRNTLLVLALAATVLLTGCYKMQQSWDYQQHVIDPHTNKTAWAFIKSRGTNGFPDTLLSLMERGIRYAGIDTAEYEKSDRTYILLQNAAVRGGVDAYFSHYQIDDVDNLGLPIQRPANSWEEYPVEQVKNYFLWLILQGEYTYDNVGSNNMNVKTLMPPGADPANPESVMGIRNYPGPQSTDLRNTQLYLNAYLNAPRPIKVVTGGFINTNGPAHMVATAPW